MGAGLLLPFVLALKSASHPLLNPGSRDRDPFPRFPLWAMGAVLLAAVFIRFYRLTRLSGWPLMDEGLTGFLAMDQAEKWKWDLFGGMTQVPSLFYWTLSFPFKVTGPSLRSLWFFPALLSFLTIPIAYWAVLPFGGRSRAWVGAALFSLSFWPFYLGRFCTPHVLLVGWEVLTLSLLGYWAKAGSEPLRRRRTMLLGLATGIGFYIHFHWVVMAFLVSLAVFGNIFFQKTRPWRLGLFFALPVLLLALPLLAVGFHEKTGNYLSMLWTLKKGFDGRAQWESCREYFSGLFWGVQTPRFIYKPFWGGFFNPLLDSSIGLGMVELFRKGPSKRALWTAAALFFFILPAWLTQELEMFRLVLLLPLLLFLALEGLGLLLEETTPSRRVLVLALFLAVSAGLDFYHLLGPYQRACHSDYATLSRYSKSFERWKAYQILKKKSSVDGPGWILTEMESSPFNQTLTTAVYPFNAARNPRLSPDKARWLGFLTNVNYAPFLAKQFPWMEFFELSPDRPLPQVTLVLGVFPLDSLAGRTLAARWLEAEKAFRPLTSQLLHLGFGQDRGALLRGLEGVEPLVEGDPFLESCLGEKVFFNAMASNRPSDALPALRRALTKGYPSANLFDDLGVYWFTQGNYAQARRAFRLALDSPLNHTTALENLRRTPGP